MAAAQVLSMPEAFTADIAAPAPRQFAVPGNDALPMTSGPVQDVAVAPGRRCSEQEAPARAGVGAGSPVSGNGGGAAKAKRGKNTRGAKKAREAAAESEQKPVQQGRNSFPCLLGRLGGGAGGPGAGAPPFVGSGEEGQRLAASIAAHKLPCPEAVAPEFQGHALPEASRGSSADGAASRSTASSGGRPELPRGRPEIPLGALLQEALLQEALELELGIGTSPPTGGLYASAAPPAHFDHQLPMKVALPSRPPPALAPQPAVCVPCRAWPPAPQPQPQPAARAQAQPPLCTAPPPGLGLQDNFAQQSLPCAVPTFADFMLAAQAAARPFAPPPGLEARPPPSRQGAAPQAVHCHIATLPNANNCMANECFGTSPGLNRAVAQFGACQATASPTFNPPLRLPQPQEPPCQSAGASPTAAFSPSCGSPAEACGKKTDMPSFGFDMQGRTGCHSPASPADARSPAGESSPGGSGSHRERRFTCKFVFSGFDLERDADFELVPRLIGRGGANMRDIAKACDGKVRIRGRGSGHREQQKGRSALEEADVPLQIALSCKDQECFEEGRTRLLALLEFITMHFERYCRRKGLVPTPTLFSVVTGA